MPQVQITATPRIGIVPLQVTFGVTVLSGVWKSFEWKFGDGEVSTEMMPRHTYGTIGYHTVVLSAYDADGGSETVVERDLIRVARLSFSVEYNSDGVPPVGAYFTNTSWCPTEYDFVDWRWTFGDISLGSGATGPTHVYGAYGNYNVTLDAKMKEIG